MNGKRRPLPHSWSSNHQQREALLTASNSRQSHCWPNVQLEKIDSVHCAAFSMRKNREKKQFSSFNKQHYAWQRRENICCFLGRYYINKGTGKALVKLRNNTSDRGNNTGGVHPCLDYTLRDYSRLDYLWLDYKDIWTIPIWTTYDVWTQIDYTVIGTTFV